MNGASGRWRISRCGAERPLICRSTCPTNNPTVAPVATPQTTSDASKNSGLSPVVYGIALGGILAVIGAAAWFLRGRQQQLRVLEEEMGGSKVLIDMV